jgi:hypothetical protein
MSLNLPVEESEAPRMISTLPQTSRLTKTKDNYNELTNEQYRTDYISSMSLKIGSIWIDM